MSERENITLTIDDRQVAGTQGDTILDVCRANDIYVPTLCYLEGLSNVGACRLCVVEIEGERRINPACTYPARDGLVVRTHTDKLEKYRRQVLELLFTERNHFCFFCEASGDCELQALGYRYQIDHMRYPYTFPSLPTDAISSFLVLDHNRCVLCGRCVRVCGEVVANYTLDFGRRGWKTLVVADLNQSLGESSCISCGACAQACPTGAVFSKASAYRGRTSEGRVVRSVCGVCGVGCEIDVLVKDNNVVRIDGADLTGPKGMLCARGRFRQVYREGRRITAPIVNTQERGPEPLSWDSALTLVADKIKEYQAGSGAPGIAALASSSCPNETLEDFAGFLRQVVGTDNIDTLDGDWYRVLAKGISGFSKNGHGLEMEGPLEAILEADCVLVVGCDPLETHPVVGSYVLRSRAAKGSQLVVLDSKPNAFGFRADLRLRAAEGSQGTLIAALASAVARKTKTLEKPLKAASVAKASEASGVSAPLIKQAAEKLADSKKLAVIYGERVINQQNPKIVAQLLDLARIVGGGESTVISLKPRGNSRGAWDMGLASRNGGVKGKPKMVYILLGDDDADTGHWIDLVTEAEFAVVQASYHSRLTECADVVLPSPTWAEREGSYVSLDGKASKSRRVVEPPRGIRDDADVLADLAARL
jgi:formate dehydrogenase major subunit